MVIHRDDSGVHLVITTFELKATKSRDRVSLLGKVPVLATSFSWHSRRGSSWFLYNSLFSSREVEAEWPGSFAAWFHILGGGMRSACWSPCGPELQK